MGPTADGGIRKYTLRAVYNSYDSDPPDEEAEKKDYGVVTSVGYSF